MSDRRIGVKRPIRQAIHLHRERSRAWRLKVDLPGNRYGDHPLGCRKIDRTPSCAGTGRFPENNEGTLVPVQFQRDCSGGTVVTEFGKITHGTVYRVPYLRLLSRHAEYRLQLDFGAALVGEEIHIPIIQGAVYKSH